MKLQLRVWKLQCLLIAAESSIPANLMLHPSDSIIKFRSLVDLEVVHIRCTQMRQWWNPFSLLPMSL